MGYYWSQNIWEFQAMHPDMTQLFPNRGFQQILRWCLLLQWHEGKPELTHNSGEEGYGYQETHWWVPLALEIFDIQLGSLTWCLWVTMVSAGTFLGAWQSFLEEGWSQYIFWLAIVDLTNITRWLFLSYLNMYTCEYRRKYFQTICSFLKASC